MPDKIKNEEMMNTPSKLNANFKEIHMPEGDASSETVAQALKA